MNFKEFLKPTWGKIGFSLILTIVFISAINLISDCDLISDCERVMYPENIQQNKYLVFSIIEHCCLGEFTFSDLILEYLKYLIAPFLGSYLISCLTVSLFKKRT